VRFFKRLFGMTQAQRAPSGDLELTLQEVLAFLNDQEVRATYGAVAEVVGGIPQSIGARLGRRRVAASWVVNASSGMPTGYERREMHPALIKRSEIIRSGTEQRKRLEIWRAARNG
jgi:hypothetical protein